MPATGVRRALEPARIAQNVHRTTFHDLLSQAVDAMCIRPTLLRRRGGQAERALANVDVYLGMSRSYAVRGLRDFAVAMTTAWNDEERAVEGRPDAQEEAVALYTMHAAKGLEWPIVIPINTMTAVMATENVVVDGQTGCLLCPVLGVNPKGFEAARRAEIEERDRERIRLWYVAATRAREVLIIPRLDCAGGKNTWIELLDLSLSSLPALDLSHLPSASLTREVHDPNTQTREVFAAEAFAIARSAWHIEWVAPSRDEGEDGSVEHIEMPTLVIPGLDAGEPIDGGPSEKVQGGRARGLVIHKLIEEVLTGELREDPGTLENRARSLIETLDRTWVIGQDVGSRAFEMAACVVRSLALPEIVAIRDTLIPEFNVFASSIFDGVETILVGTADAIGFDAAGRPNVVVDWKSDVDPNVEQSLAIALKLGAISRLRAPPSA